MNSAFRFTFTSLVAIAVCSAVMFGQNPGSAVGRAAPTGSASTQGQIGSAVPATSGVGFVPFVQPYYYPSYSWFGAYASPFLYLPTPPPARSYLPNYWWLGGYPSEDPRQEGYNPQAGYPADTVTTLLLVTFPAKARVTLDGVFVGRSEEHTSELQSRLHLVCRLLLEKKKTKFHARSSLWQTYSKI